MPSDPGQAPENCVTGGGSTYCFQDQESGCGTFNGQQGCFETESGCGYFNGTWGCYPANQETRNCGYANGEQVCFDPKNPTQQIPQDSPDHPKNGGNADGNENNDPKAPGSTGNPGAQDGDQGATNEGLDQLGDKLGAKIDKTNSLLGGITDLLGGIGEQLDELLGDDYDGSGDGNGDAIGSEAQGLGEQLGGMIGEQTEQLVGERDSEAQEALEDTIPELVAGQGGMFDPDGYVVASLDFLNDVLPSAYGCNAYAIEFNLGEYYSALELPVCELTRLKPLLEYLVWMITIVGFWKILYAGLRLEDAKANKGGF
ncbi:hypothetical protein I0D68_05310 [Pseudomonas lalucatii]|nr:hypothetical protein I0D68_05310 [Pseudomonas lalucatii]